VYRPISRREISDALIHIRNLYRRNTPKNEPKALREERREAVIRDLLSNLARTSEHPTLKTLLEVSETCQLTLEGAHRLFGYDLRSIREFDFQLNGGRTHIFESYPFERDLPIDLPARLASHAAFDSDAPLGNLVREWHTAVPIRALESESWTHPGTFYVHVGTEDSIGSSIPPGSMASVEPVADQEKMSPNPRRTYLLQFGNGYRCSQCLVSRGRLLLLGSDRIYRDRETFTYPGSVRIAGRIRMFAMSLPMPEYPQLYSLPDSRQSAALILPWEHTSRDQLLATKRKRFKRTREEVQFVSEFLRQELHSNLSARSERRYRSATSSDPHVNTLIHLSVATMARYTDALRAGGSWLSDEGRFSLDALLCANRLEDAWAARHNVKPPEPVDVWQARRNEFGGWPPLLSLKFPELRLWDNRVVRLAHGILRRELTPSIGPGSWLLLEETQSMPDTESERRTVGWLRPIYVLRRGLDMICGYLEREGTQLALITGEDEQPQAALRSDELHQLSRVRGIAVPV
jgi:hypothetical protein